MVRRIGVIGDVHGDVAALRLALGALNRSNVDAVVCVGDLIGSERDIDPVLDLLSNAGARVVRGNHDRWLLEDAASSTTSGPSRSALEKLAQLPTSLYIKTVAGLAMVCHGFADNDLATMPTHFGGAFLRRALRLGVLPPACSVVLCGHTHSRQVREQSGLLFVRVGALSAPSKDGCVVYDAAAHAVTVLRY